MRNTVPPQKIPSIITNDKELYPYFKSLTDFINQVWHKGQGNQNSVLISSTKDIDLTQTGSTELFKVPETKNFIPLYVVIRVVSFTAGSKSTQAVLSFGGNDPSYDDFINSVTYTVANVDTFQIDQPSNATELAIQSSGNSFRSIVETASDADIEKCNIDLFGYLT